VDKLGILVWQAAVGINDFHIFWIKFSRLHVHYKVKLAEYSVFEIFQSSDFLSEATFFVGKCRRWNCQADGKAGLESIPRTDVTDLGDVGFNKLETISLNSSIPGFQLIFNAPSSGSNPLQFKMEDSGRVVDDIMMEGDWFRLVALLLRLSVRIPTGG
jgi:hypothetical protein